MKLVPGEMVAVAGDPDDFASQTVALLQDEVAWTRMSDAAARFAARELLPGGRPGTHRGNAGAAGAAGGGDTLRKPGARKGDSGRSRDGSA